jgi:hypothetical protein
MGVMGTLTSLSLSPRLLSHFSQHELKKSKADCYDSRAESIAAKIKFLTEGTEGASLQSEKVYSDWRDKQRDEWISDQ